MNSFQIAIPSAAIITMIVSWRLPNAALYISLGIANAVACDVYYALALPYPEAFTLACDALMCLAIHWVAQEKWEFAIYGIFAISVLVSVFRLLAWVASIADYRLYLELLNWAALGSIFGTAVLGGARDNVFHSRWRSYVSWAIGYLRAPRSRPHWSKVREKWCQKA